VDRVGAWFVGSYLVSFNVCRGVKMRFMSLLEVELFVKDMENKCPGLIGCGPKEEVVLGGKRVLSS
jgi:hypothetical protein